MNLWEAYAVIRNSINLFKLRSKRVELISETPENVLHVNIELLLASVSLETIAAYLETVSWFLTEVLKIVLVSLGSMVWQHAYFPQVIWC